jgi:hypothetical protein
MNIKMEWRYKMEKRIEFEDDLVVVRDVNGKVIYKGEEDYEPMRDEDWKFNKSKNLYELEGNDFYYTKEVLEVR